MTRHRYPIAAFAGIALLSACQQSKEPHSPASAAPTETPGTAPVLPTAEKPLDRGQLLLAVAQAASDAALGRSDVDRQRTLDGKAFELRLRFGCPTDRGGSRAWTYDDKRRKLSLRIEPEITAHDAMIEALGQQGYEAVEGFWIRRPWQLAAACSAPVETNAVATSATAGPEAHSPTASEPLGPMPKIGLAQFYTDEESRTHRRDSRAYTASKILPEGTQPSDRGYDLVIKGRLRKLASGTVIACRNRGTAAPPDCVASALIDSVAILDPNSGQIIAEWSSS